MDGQVEHIVLDGQVATGSVNVETGFVINDDDFCAESISQVGKSGLKGAVRVQHHELRLDVSVLKDSLHFITNFLGLLGGLLYLSDCFFARLWCLRIFEFKSIDSDFLFTLAVNVEAGQPKLLVHGSYEIHGGLMQPAIKQVGIFLICGSVFAYQLENCLFDLLNRNFPLERFLFRSHLLLQLICDDSHVDQFTVDQVDECFGDC